MEFCISFIITAVLGHAESHFISETTISATRGGVRSPGGMAQMLAATSYICLGPCGQMINCSHLTGTWTWLGDMHCHAGTYAYMD